MFIHLDIWKFLNVEILYRNIIFQRWYSNLPKPNQEELNQAKQNKHTQQNNQKIKDSGFNTWGLIFYSQCALVFSYSKVLFPNSKWKLWG